MVSPLICENIPRPWILSSPFCFLFLFFLSKYTLSLPSFVSLRTSFTRPCIQARARARAQCTDCMF